RRHTRFSRDWSSDVCSSDLPSRYGALLDDVRLVAVTGVGPVPDQNAALRLVVLVDRLYDRDVPVALGGGGPATVFTEPMLAGGRSEERRVGKGGGSSWP